MYSHISCKNREKILNGSKVTAVQVCWGLFTSTVCGVRRPNSVAGLRVNNGLFRRKIFMIICHNPHLLKPEVGVKQTYIVPKSMECKEDRVQHFVHRMIDASGDRMLIP